MTTTQELKDIMKARTPLPLDWMVATGQPVTEENMQAAQNAQKYQNREKIQETYLWMADLYNELTKQEPTKRVFTDWVATFEDWKQEKLQPEHIRAAWLEANNEKGGFFVGRPGALTVVAVSMKSKMTVKPAAPVINSAAVEETRRIVEERMERERQAVPRPANCPRPNFGAKK